MVNTGGVNEAAVAPAIAVPPEFELVGVEYHWYAAVPVPPAKATVKGLVVPPTQILWRASGWVVTEATDTTSILAGLEVTVVQVPVVPKVSWA